MTDDIRRYIMRNGHLAGDERFLEAYRPADTLPRQQAVFLASDARLVNTAGGERHDHRCDLGVPLLTGEGDWTVIAVVRK